MSLKKESNEQKMDLSKLGQFYSPIDFFDYGPSQTTSEINDSSPKNTKKLDSNSCTPNIINIINNKKQLKVKFKKCTKVNDSFGKKANNSYNISSRNDNNINEITTTLSTIDDKTNITSINTNSTIEEKNKIIKLKELMICFLCNEKIVKPKICSKCFKIFCEKCIKKWFINDKNKKCYYCNSNISIDDMINIPIINSISNILNKKTIDVKNDASLVLKQLNSRISKINKDNKNNNNNNNNDSSRSNISCYTTGNLMQKSPNNSLDLRNCLKKIKHRKFPNSISESRKANISKNVSIYNEHCQIHQDQFLFYYCVNCEKSYCRTCFVFFGEEKNKHVGHKIIDYDKFKDKNNFELLKLIKELKENSDKISSFINKCENLKNCYNFERKIVNNYIKTLINNYNAKFEENIKILNKLINNYKNYFEQINKERDNIKKYYSSNNYNFNLKSNISEINILNEIKKINKIEFVKDVDNFANLSPKFLFNIYNTDIKHYDILDKQFRFKTKLNNSKYNLVVLKKEKEIQIYIYYPIEKEIKNKKFIFPFIYLKKKNNNWEIFELKENLTYNGNNYFIQRFNPENFCEINSYIKIKGILYESFFI